MNMQTKLVASPEPLTGLALLLDRFERDDIENAIDLLIAMLDARDGDPDAQQANGDELDGSSEEEDIPGEDGNGLNGPGCPIADDDTEIENEPGLGDPAYIEWGTRGRHKIDRHGAEPLHRNPYGSICVEDQEDDDPGEEDGEDQCEAGDDGVGYHIAGHRSGWGSTFDHGRDFPDYGLNQDAVIQREFGA